MDAPAIIGGLILLYRSPLQAPLHFFMEPVNPWCVASTPRLEVHVVYVAGAITPRIDTHAGTASLKVHGTPVFEGGFSLKTVVDLFLMWGGFQHQESIPIAGTASLKGEWNLDTPAIEWGDN